jgi:hypothetical protein
MKTFLGMEVEQNDDDIKLHLDHYIQTVLAEYRDYIKKALRHKKVPITPGVVLHPEQAPAVPDRHKQKYYQTFVAKLQRQRGPGWISPSQYRSWLASVLRQVLHNGQPSITSWNTWKAARASR